MTVFGVTFGSQASKAALLGNKRAVVSAEVIEKRVVERRARRRLLCMFARPLSVEDEGELLG